MKWNETKLISKWINNDSKSYNNESTWLYVGKMWSWYFECWKDTDLKKTGTKIWKYI